MQGVQLLGGAKTTDALAPIKPGQERWGLNSHFNHRFGGKVDDWTRWFDLHPKQHIKTVRPAAYEWYTKQTNPVYLIAHDPNIPAAAVYPLTDVQRTFYTADGPERYFLSSFDYMMALALYEGFERIDIYWFRMMNHHYAWQLPSAMYWLGRARGLGVTVVVHGESNLAPQNKLYGYETV
jgi:hypothetical protein